MRRIGATIALMTAICLGAIATHAAPFVPKDDSQVLESGLPDTDPRVRQIHDIALQLAAAPDNLALAMRLASRQLAMGVDESDPRFVGYAQGTLTKWWDDPAAKPPLRVLRARITQAQHNFAPAAADLRRALADEPNTPEALLVLASIDEVTGDFTEARASCAKFAQIRPSLAAFACAASVGAVTGSAKSSYDTLADAVAHITTLDRAQLLWSLTILGETAIQLDDPAANERLKEALALDSRNVYAAAVYADYLLSRGQADEVLRRLRGFDRIDTLYLRFALAAQAVGDPEFPRYRDDLVARFAAARRQGDLVHLRDAARFALDIEHDGPRALDLALQNWQSNHKTPADLRVLLAAAVACHDADAVKPAIDWIVSTRLEDRTIEDLRRRLAAPG
jgi:tetratricopeptide (TPR) repeat protein